MFPFAEFRKRRTNFSKRLPGNPHSYRRDSNMYEASGDRRLERRRGLKLESSSGCYRKLRYFVAIATTSLLYKLEGGVDIHNRKGCMRFIRSGYSLGGMGEYNVEKNVEK
ncbi:hypothetical protein ZYGM_003432 [Zygosaccharomyces mellis]|uniref:Uncharacterized protein n=1 Tax=Zygosaccharomyces mellis TaxID=42258 RepID=A0A4C2EB81_9SACH|nr:hypothetical protein ZYGM_003432 [Zygosaccharomyces mellis]